MLPIGWGCSVLRIDIEVLMTYARQLDMLIVDKIVKWQLISKEDRLTHLDSKSCILRALYI
jgi:hypothetical protein